MMVFSRRFNGLFFATLTFLILGLILGIPSVTMAAENEPSEETIREDASDDDFSEFEDEFEDAASSEVFDPLSGYNRVMTRFNDKFYDWVAKPVAKGYQFVLPVPVRESVGRFFKNLFFPLRLANNLLQLKFKNAAIETARFTVNSTVGLLGLFDPAWHWLHLDSHPEDFGQTLGHYGVGSGFHIVLPILGPSNLRDLVGFVPEYYATPWAYLPKDEQYSLVESYRRLNVISLELGKYDILRKDALDLYILLRNTYEENRAMKIEE